MVYYPINCMGLGEICRQKLHHIN